jgi:hypothetical protein
MNFKTFAEVASPDIYKKYTKEPAIIQKPPGWWESKTASMWDAKGLKFALYNLYQHRNKGALLVLGDAGIGKSDIVKNYARTIASREGREYVNFDNLNVEGKEHIYKNPEKYYVYLDLRASTLNPEAAAGIPDIEYAKTQKNFQFLPPDWIHVITNPKCHAFVFLDEINRSESYIVNSLFNFILDRRAAGRPVSPDVMIVAAANMGEWTEGTVKVDAAFMSRFSTGVLVAKVEDWVDWARSAGINKHIIDFAESNPAENFYGTPEDVLEGNIPINPRQLEFASIGMNVVESNYVNYHDKGTPLPEEYSGDIYDDIGRVIQERLKNDWANRFIQWLKYVHEFDWATVVQRAKAGALKTTAGKAATAEQLSTSKKWALCKYVAEHVLTKFYEARKQGNVPEAKKALSELYGDLYTILANTDTDNVSFLIKKLAAFIKDNKELPPEERHESWITMMTPIVKKAQTENADFYKHLKALLEELKKAMPGPNAA